MSWGLEKTVSVAIGYQNSVSFFKRNCKLCLCGAVSGVRTMAERMDCSLASSLHDGTEGLSLCRGFVVGEQTGSVAGCEGYGSRGIQESMKTELGSLTIFTRRQEENKRDVRHEVVPLITRGFQGLSIKVLKDRHINGIEGCKETNGPPKWPMVH